MKSYWLWKRWKIAVPPPVWSIYTCCCTSTGLGEKSNTSERNEAHNDQRSQSDWTYSIAFIFHIASVQASERACVCVRPGMLLCAPDSLVICWWRESNAMVCFACVNDQTDRSVPPNVLLQSMLFVSVFGCCL